jgi:hypothetical protein
MNKHLENLKANNPELIIIEDVKGYTLSRPWNDKSMSFFFLKKSIFSKLKDIVFPHQLAAIYNKESKIIEYIYGPVEKTEVRNARKFDIYYKKQKFTCYFGEISKTLHFIAKHFKEALPDSATEYRNIRYLRDILINKRIYKHIIRKSDLISFYIQGNFEAINFDFTGLSKTVNFYMTYFDRDTPTILIFSRETDDPEHEMPCYFEHNKQFPASINAQNIDTTLLDIIQVAHKAEDIRLRFVFYFQVLEYCSYYYLNNKIKNKIHQTLRNPDLAEKPESFTKSLIEDLKDHFSQNDDSIKLEQTITEYVSIEDLQLEIECNKDFFSKDITFDGGLKINRILQTPDSIDSLKKDDLVLIKKNIEKIRNVLVHLRESRENKVILPTEENDNKLLPYLYLIRRLAEKVAIQYE